VRSPRFEPGSSAWQADVLDQTRLRPLSTSLRHFQIPEVLIKLKASGLSEGSLRGISDNLKRLNKYSKIDNPEEIKSYIASLSVDNSYKMQLAKCYDYYASVCGIEWLKPKYRYERKIPKIPMKEKILQVISASRKYCTIFKVLLETGIMPYELSKLSKEDLDSESCILSVRGFKGHNSRAFKLTKETTAMLVEYFGKYSKIPDARWICRMWRDTRNKVAKKLQDESIHQIKLYDLRRYYACHLYDISKDIMLVARQLGHKKVTTTQLYVQLMSFVEEEEYTCKAVNNLKEAMELVENGFTFVVEMDGYRLFKKRK
jgi:integrase